MQHLNPSPPAVSRSVLADHAYTVLHGAILRGELSAGAPVRETELAAQLGISRTPVREALRRLFLEGFLTRTQTGSAIVSEVTPTLVREAFDLRKLLEGYAARQAAQVITPEDVERLEAVIAQAERLIAAEAWEQISQLNDQFHGAIEQLAHNSLLTKTTRGLREQIAAYGAFVSGDMAQQTDFVQEHRALLAALAAHDSQRAEALAIQHLDGAMAVLLATRSAAEQR